MSEATVLTALFAELEEAPCDIATLRALADWLEDDDQPKPAECVRWLADTGKVPFKYALQEEIMYRFDGWRRGWFWWTTGIQRPNWGYPKSCRLPRMLWQPMKHTFDYDPMVFKEYPTVRAAIEAVMAAWTRRPRTSTRKKKG